jgi:gluconate:H+ symporter, GntP family
VIVSSGFAQEALGRMTLLVPIILVPFILAAVIETAQGSRVVTAVITAEVLAGIGIRVVAVALEYLVFPVRAERNGFGE